MKPFFTFLFLFSYLLTIQAQRETAHWFFSNHVGLSFISGSPVVDLSGQVSNEEGCASISDNSGQLMFYTDGVNVWNRNHQLMPNGNNLLGDDSTTQSAIIIPLPGTETYYIFTVDEAFSAPSPDGINYTVVDMSLDGGLGDVVNGQKNIPLVTHASEKIAAVANAAGDGYWVVVFAPSTSSTGVPYDTTGGDFTTFYAFEVKATGIVTSVVSPANISVQGGVGYMKLSPDATRLAIANMLDYTVYVFDFDNSTGVVSNPDQLPLPAQYNEPYGLEFSPDGTKLYINNRGSTVVNYALMQFDLSNANSVTVISTELNYRAALQLALDGKIYQTHTLDYGTGTQFLNVINHPNATASQVDYQRDAIDLGAGQTCHQGLPNFIASFLHCQSNAQIVSSGNDTYEITTNEAFTSVTWDFGDGSQPEITYPDNPPDNNHTLVHHVFPNQDPYTILATIDFENNCAFEAVLDVNVNAVEDYLAQNIKVYPNPATDIVHISLPETEVVKISVLDISGNYIYKNIPVYADTYQLNMKGKKGLFLVKITTDKHSLVKKILLK